jgi:cyclopropane fatty-acyl-phospholipid synthase-like methyltransferase
LGYTNVAGVDISRENCDYAASLGIGGIIHSDLGQFLARNGGYDVIVMRDVLEHLNKAEILSTLALIHRALNTGGALIIQVPNSEGLFGAKCRYADFTHEVSFTASSIRQVLSVSGFSSVLLNETGPVPHGIRSVLRWVAWVCLKGIVRGYSLVEGGAATGIYTQTLIACAKK